MKEFINFPAIRFKKSEISHDALKRIFYDEEQVGLLWRFSYIAALNNQNYNLANFLADGENVTLPKYLIDVMLSEYSLENGNPASMMDTLVHVAGDYVYSISADEDKMVLSTQDGLIKAQKLYYALPNLKTLFPEADKKSRIGRCHEFCLRFAKNYDYDSLVATGYVAPLSQKNKNLHSWIEMELGGEEVVVDFTRGLVFNKDGYYLLKNIRCNAVQKIDRKTVAKDSEMIDELASADGFYSKLYLANRKQAIEVYQELLQAAQPE